MEWTRSIFITNLCFEVSLSTLLKHHTLHIIRHNGPTAFESLQNFSIKFLLMKTKALEICSKMLGWRHSDENYVYPYEISILNSSVLQFCITPFGYSKILSLWPSWIKIYSFFAEQARANISPVKLLGVHGFFLRLSPRFIS